MLVDQHRVAIRVDQRPVVQFAVRGTGLDLDRLQLTAARLSQHGPGLILDQTFENGNRLLVWTE